MLLSKADKLTRAESTKALAGTRSALENAAMASEVILFSSKNAQGVEQTRALLDGWLREAAGTRVAERE